MNQTSHSHSHPQQEHNSSANAVGTTGSDKSARTLIKRWFLLSALLHGSTWSPCQQLHACSASVWNSEQPSESSEFKIFEDGFHQQCELKGPGSELRTVQSPNVPTERTGSPFGPGSHTAEAWGTLIGWLPSVQMVWAGWSTVCFVLLLLCLSNGQSETLRLLKNSGVHESSVEFLDLGGLALKHLFLTWHKTCTPGTRCFSTRWWRQKRRNISGAKSKTICYTIEI